MNTDIKVIGVGLWRTGTYSLKLALEELTGQPCMHMSELMPKSADLRVRKWLLALRHQRLPHWPELFSGYGSTTDWPALAFWQDLIEFYPGARVLLSTRDSESWWHSVSRTVIQAIPSNPKNKLEELIMELFARDFIKDKASKDEAIKFYENHNDLVRKTVPAERLIDWRLGDGWQPICDSLGLPIPVKAFPHANRASEFRQGNRLS